MKSVLQAAVVAFFASVTTVLTLEFIRSPAPPAARTDVRLAQTETTAPSEPQRDAPALVAEARGAEGEPTLVTAEWIERLEALERRLTLLEARQPDARTPVEQEPDALPEQDDLREMVLSWVAEDRAERGRAAQVEAAERKLKEQEFSARYQAHMLALEHDLPQWEEDKLFAIFLEIGRRSKEVEAQIDPMTQDPAEVEALWEEFDRWVEQFERNEMGPDLWKRIADGGADQDE